MKNKSGLTLIEVIISLLILGIIIVPISLFFSNSMSATMSNKKKLSSTQLAQKYIEELKSLNYDQLVTKFTSVATSSNESNINITTLINGYKRTFTYIPTGFLVELELLKTFATDDISLTNSIDNTTWDHSVTLNDTTTPRTLTITYTTDNKVTIEETGQALIQKNVTSYNFKLFCTGTTTVTNHLVNFYNKSTTPVNLYVVKDIDTATNVNIISKEGTVNQKVTSLSSNNNLIYTIRTTIKKDGKILTSVESTKL